MIAIMIGTTTAGANGATMMTMLAHVTATVTATAIETAIETAITTGATGETMMIMATVVRVSAAGAVCGMWTPREIQPPRLRMLPTLSAVQKLLQLAWPPQQPAIRWH